jgi:SAM-dependent methyltransferase
VDPRLLALLACPTCRGELAASEGALRCAACARDFPIQDGIPRFVPSENYTGSFGFQWNTFDRTQLGLAAATEARFWKETRWPRQLPGAVIVEAGCGAGRFTALAASTGALVVSVDASRAVEAAKRNNPLPNVLFLQADIRALPLKAGVADKVYCFGVLQHTPDPEESFRALLPSLKPGGEVACDVYQLSWRTLLAGKYALRPITKRIPPRVLFALVRIYFAVLWVLLAPFHWILCRRAWRVGALLGVTDYRGVHDLPAAKVRELSLLDTFDMLSPAHDHPKTLGQVRRWLERAGLDAIEVGLGHNGVLAHGRVRSTPAAGG